MGESRVTLSLTQLKEWSDLNAVVENAGVTKYVKQ